MAINQEPGTVLFPNEDAKTGFDSAGYLENILIGEMGTGKADAKACTLCKGPGGPCGDKAVRDGSPFIAALEGERKVMFFRYPGTFILQPPRIGE